MSEQTPEPTTASDMQAGGAKQGNDYGSPGTTSEQEGTGGEAPAGSGGETPWAGAADAAAERGGESGGESGAAAGEWGAGASGLDDSGGLRGGGSDPGGAAAADLGGSGGGSDLNEGAGGSDPGSDPNGAAIPDEADAAAAQGGVQQAFSVAPQD